MSEFQYYEFKAVDHPLGRKEMRELSELSSRARITPTSFVNHYDYGDFHKSDLLMERYFDLHVYLANWGTRIFAMRLPLAAIDPGRVAAYCVELSASMRTTADHLILTFQSNEDGADDYGDDGSGWMARLTPLRAELLRGDLRCLYLGWLLTAQHDLDDDAPEPPRPPGLRSLSSALKVFVEHLRIDPALLAAAAEAGDDEAFTDVGRAETGATMRASRRTVGELLAMAEKRAEQMEREAAAREVAAEARRAAREARRRAPMLAELAGRADAAWREVESKIATFKPAEYGRAVALLRDLRDASDQVGRRPAFDEHLQALRAQHQTKRALIKRLDEADLR